MTVTSRRRGSTPVYYLVLTFFSSTDVTRGALPVPTTFRTLGGHLPLRLVPPTTSITDRVTLPLGRFLLVLPRSSASGPPLPSPPQARRDSSAEIRRGSNPLPAQPPAAAAAAGIGSLQLAKPAHLMSIFLPAPWWMRGTCPGSTRRPHPDLAAAAAPPGGETTTTTPCSPGPWARGGPCFALLRSRPEGRPAGSARRLLLLAL
ncbi:hypothetical protein PVAP13_5KG342007 [Panicum virgatum]|uniref:Uncharacterized protein n=1 Tax=Panicum virgatum TaxID=38727 RepID=A0A8T0SJ82_PANVG|nr:hypothetical protein PVAP13_5KG342007 [Panicum virgatum]